MCDHEWRKIESAPLDGQWFLAWVGPTWNNCLPFVRTRWRGYWRNESDNGGMPANFSPSHWTPMLAAPKGEVSP